MTIPAETMKATTRKQSFIKMATQSVGYKVLYVNNNYGHSMLSARGRIFESSYEDLRKTSYLRSD